MNKKFEKLENVFISDLDVGWLQGEAENDEELKEAWKINDELMDRLLSIKTYIGLCNGCEDSVSAHPARDMYEFLEKVGKEFGDHRYRLWAEKDDENVYVDKDTTDSLDGVFDDLLEKYNNL